MILIIMRRLSVVYFVIGLATASYCYPYGGRNSLTVSSGNLIFSVFKLGAFRLCHHEIFSRHVHERHILVTKNIITRNFNLQTTLVAVPYVLNRNIGKPRVFFFL